MPNFLIKLFRNKNLHGVPIHKPVKQKKYFSLMLVPSYTSGKVRSVRISTKTFYAISFILLTICLTIAYLSIQTRFIGRELESFSGSLLQVQAAYEDLYVAAELEQDQLIEGVMSMQQALIYERRNNQLALEKNRAAYLENLDAILTHTEILEAKLRQYEEYRQEIIERLRESSHIRVVNNILYDIQQSQMDLMLTLEDLNDLSINFNDAPEAEIAMFGFVSYAQVNGRSNNQISTADDLFNYMSMLEDALEMQSELFTELKEQVSTAAPHIRRDRYGPRLLEWSYVRNVLPRNTPVKITDVRTGLTYRVISFSHGNHADVFAASPEDTAVLFRTFGGQWSWNTRPIWVHIGDRKVAASINGMPHGGTGNRNGMNGHVCIHFRGSRTHSGSRFHEQDHQRSVLEAYRANF